MNWRPISSLAQKPYVAPEFTRTDVPQLSVYVRGGLLAVGDFRLVCGGCKGVLNNFHQGYPAQGAPRKSSKDGVLPRVRAWLRTGFTWWAVKRFLFLGMNLRPVLQD